MSGGGRDDERREERRASEDGKTYSDGGKPEGLRKPDRWVGAEIAQDRQACESGAQTGAGAADGSHQGAKRELGASTGGWQPDRTHPNRR